MVAGALSTTPDWYIAKCRSEAVQAASIERFRDRQSTERNWIALDELGDLVATQPPRHPADNLNRLATLVWLTDLAERECLTMFLVDASCPIIPDWFNCPEKAPARAFVTAHQLKAWINIHGRSVVAEQITAKCYIPRVDAMKLLHAAGVVLRPTWATELVRSSSTKSSTVISFQQHEVPKRPRRIASRETYKAYAIDFQKCKEYYSSRMDDDEWRKKMGFTRDSVRMRRRQYKATLSPKEQSIFGKSGPKQPGKCASPLCRKRSA